MLILPLLAVKNYDAALKFYTEKLGFTSILTTQGAEGPNTFGFVTHGEGVQLGLSQDSSDLSGRGKGVELMLYPTDVEIDALYEKIKGADVAIASEIRTEIWGDRLFSIKDPDGYYLTFCKTVAAMPPIEEIEAKMRSQS